MLILFPNWLSDKVQVLLVIFALSPFSSLSAAPEYKWERLEGCTLADGWRDGDSFTVRVSPRVFRTFRLYFVDTPEDGKDRRFPDRVAAQSAYFGTTQARAFEIGHAAAAFTEQTLSAKPFTVWTFWRDALGSSKRQRFYAMVEIDGKWLSSLLVEQGLARIYGVRVQLPDGTDSRTYLQSLAELETSAKREGKGGWKPAVHKN